MNRIFDSDEVCRFVVRGIKHPSAERSFLQCHGKGFEEWKAQTREWVTGLLHYSPPRVPLDAVVEHECDFETYTMRKIVFSSAEDCRIPAYLLIPRGLERPAPAVLALHDHSRYYYWGKEKLLDMPDRRDSLSRFQLWRYGGRGYASALAERGYVVMVIDALGFGERGLQNESWLTSEPDYPPAPVCDAEESIRAFNSAGTERMTKLALSILHGGSTYMGILLWDDMRSVDYLRSLSIVDRDRIAAMGLSMGGYRTIWLMALDDRVHCGCCAGFMMRLDDMVPRHPTALWSVVPGLSEKLPYPDLTGLIAPKELLVMYCENDTFSLSSMQSAIDVVQKVYHKAAAPTSFESVGYPVGHQFDLVMQSSAFQWLDKRLKLSSS